MANKKAELEFEQRSMASLLSKFRIDYSDLQLIPDITKKPQESSTQFFNELMKEFTVSEKENESANATKILDDEGKQVTNLSSILTCHCDCWTLKHSLKIVDRTYTYS